MSDPSRLLRGRVVDAAGRGVAGASVAVEWGTAPTPEIALLTGGDGAFAVALPPGRFRLAAYGPAGERGTAEVEGGGEDEVTVRLGV